MADVIYADDALVAVAKVAGEPVIPPGAGPRDACLHRAPILFDPICGRAIPREITDGAPCARLALHAWRLVLPKIGGTEVPPHDGPGGSADSLVGRNLSSAAPVVLEAPLAPDLVALGAWLDAEWRAEPLTS